MLETFDKSFLEVLAEVSVVNAVVFADLGGQTKQELSISLRLVNDLAE